MNADCLTPDVLQRLHVKNEYAIFFVKSILACLIAFFFSFFFSEDFFGFAKPERAYSSAACFPIMLERNSVSNVYFCVDYFPPVISVHIESEHVRCLSCAHEITQFLRLELMLQGQY